MNASTDITIFSAQGCPFAHRTRALLEHLGEPYEVREVDLDNRNPELLEQSPTGKVPFLVDGDVRLFESRVINDYLAEKLSFAGSYADDVELRALQRLFMERWDAVVTPAFYRSLRDPDYLDDDVRESLSRELSFMEGTIARIDGHDRPAAVNSLPAIHAATHWARMDWLRELTPLAEIIGGFPKLKSWLDRAAALPAVQKTLPDREATIERYRKRYAKWATR